MSSQKLILWAPHVSEHIPKEASGKGSVQGIHEGAYMHEDLATLVNILQSDGRRWSVAKIECDNDYVASGNPRPRWYKALCDIPSKDGFMPLIDAVKTYIKP